MTAVQRETATFSVMLSEDRRSQLNIWLRMLVLTKVQDVLSTTEHEYIDIISITMQKVSLILPNYFNYSSTQSCSLQPPPMSRFTLIVYGKFASFRNPTVHIAHVHSVLWATQKHHLSFFVFSILVCLITFAYVLDNGVSCLFFSPYPCCLSTCDFLLVTSRSSRKWGEGEP